LGAVDGCRVESDQAHVVPLDDAAHVIVVLDPARVLDQVGAHGKLDHCRALLGYHEFGCVHVVVETQVQNFLPRTPTLVRLALNEVGLLRGVLTLLLVDPLLLHEHLRLSQHIRATDVLFNLGQDLLVLHLLVVARRQVD